MVYLLVGNAVAAISRRFGGGARATGATRTLQVIATTMAFPLALWVGLALSHGEKTWAWNTPIFDEPHDAHATGNRSIITGSAETLREQAAPERIPLPPSLQNRPIILRPQHTADLLGRYGEARIASYETLQRAAARADAAMSMARSMPNTCIMRRKQP